MDLSRDLTKHLNDLTEALDLSGDDLNTILDVLVEDVRAGIDSFVGLSIMVSAGGEPITLTAMNAHTAASSMLLPLGEAHAGGGHIVLYAQNPGAFVDLAADARTMLGSDADVILDGHLPPPTPFAEQLTIQGLSDRSTIDQAVGVLIEQGYPPLPARVELARRAAVTGNSLAQIAARILGAVPPPDPEDQQEDDDERTG